MGQAFFYDKNGKAADEEIHSHILSNEDAIDAALVDAGVLDAPIELKPFTPEEKKAWAKGGK